MNDEVVTFLRERLYADGCVARARLLLGSDNEEANRQLAEVEAKRRILDEIAPSLEAVIEEFEGEFLSDWPQPGSEHLLRLLALPYAGHPAYRPEWKP